MATKLLYRVPEVMEATGIGRSTLYELMASGRLESVKVGRTRLVPHDALEAFVAELVENSRAESTDGDSTSLV